MDLDTANRVLECAYEDWRGGASEADQSPDGRLAAIFRDSGFANGVTHQQSGKVNDWCGMAVGAWLVRAGMPVALRKSFLHCLNIEAFATYGRQANVNRSRLMTHVKLDDGSWQPIAGWHAVTGWTRRWINESTVRAGPAAEIDIRLGDIVLIDYSGIYDREPDEPGDWAKHITIAAEFRDGVLEVMNGNASGLDTAGRKVADAVARTRHDLNDTHARKRIYGICRLSPLDFEPREYRR